MILTFERKILQQIIAAVETGTGHRVPYTGEGWSCPLDTTPGLLLVGDEGVYLLGNNERGPDEPFLIAYANEANPKRMEFYEYRSVKEASFGGDDGCMFLDMDTVKSQMLGKAIPFIDLTPESYALGCVDTLDELFEEPIKEATPVIKIDDIDEMVEADCEAPDDEEEKDEEEYSDYEEEEEPLISWRHYRASAQVPFDFAVKEMDVDPEDYIWHDYNLGVDIFMNPQNLWAKFSLDGYGELGSCEIDATWISFKGELLHNLAVWGMFAWHESEEHDLAENSYEIMCEFNPDRLPSHLSRGDFRETMKSAIEEISPKSTMRLKKGDYYMFKNHASYDDAFLQFLVYRWIMNNRPELEPHRWLTIHSGEPNNCFNKLISECYGWPDCEIHGRM